MKRNKKPLNKYFTTSSLDKSGQPINYDLLEKNNKVSLACLNSQISELKIIKLKLIDKLVEVYERNGSKHKEFTLKNELDMADKNLSKKLKEKEKLLKSIIKTL